MSFAALGGEAAEPGTVYLAGAGPGDPRFLTLRTVRLLETATLVLPDDLVSPQILSLANAAATIQSVGKRCGAARTTQAEIQRLMIESARAGKSVLRLKSGDPLVFGRVGEEIAALRAAAIPLEIVPGITAAFGAAARLQTPLTDRASASKLILATAHHAADKETGEGNATSIWSGPLPPDATLIIYMPGRDFEALAHNLIRSGIAPETPCVAMSQATQTSESSITTHLAKLRNADVGPAPVILLIGNAINLVR